MLEFLRVGECQAPRVTGCWANMNPPGAAHRILFPAWLAHSVDANASSETRVSVSFNLMFPRFAETLAQPLWGGTSALTHPREGAAIAVTRTKPTTARRRTS